MRGEAMMRSAGSRTWRVAVQALAILLCLGGLASGQKTAKKMAPDNHSPHPAPEQPIPYSHKQNLAFMLPSAKGHTNPQPPKLIPFPDTPTCMPSYPTIAKHTPA